VWDAERETSLVVDIAAATAEGFLLLSADNAPRRLIGVESDVAGNRMNNGKVDRRGRF
jgi:hypothetical protein